MSAAQEVGDIFGEGKGPAQAMLRSPTVLIVGVGLWGMNIFFFRLFGINYKYVLNYDLMVMNEQQVQQADDDNNNNNNNNNSSVVKQQQLQQQQLVATSSTPNDSADEEEDESYYEQLLLPEQAHTHTHTHSNNSNNSNSAAAITWYKLVFFSLILLVSLHFTTHFWMDRLGRGSIGAVFSFYGVVFVYIFLPIGGSNRWLRRAFVIVLQRSFELINPRCSWLLFIEESNNTTTSSMPRPIPFVDVFFADAMCSLSKVFFDWGMLLHMASHYPEPVPPSMHNILIPSACAAVPYFIRARQCLVMHSIGRLKKDPKRYQHLANALKYTTSLFPLFLSAYQKTIDPRRAEELEGLLLLLLTINALYALYWDIVMDWGMMQNPTAMAQKACLYGGTTTTTAYAAAALDNGNNQQSPRRLPTKCHHGFLRPRLRFGLTMSTLILITDAVLRFSWMFRFVNRRYPNHNQLNHDAFVLCTQFLEVFRRAIWNLLRVEWEHIKQNKAKAMRTTTTKARDSLSDCDEDLYEEERMSFLMVKPKPTNHAPRDSVVGVGTIITTTTSMIHTTTKPVHTGSKLVQD